MDKNEVIQALKTAREVSKKRNFKQSIDLVINVRNLNLKKPEQNIDLFLQLPVPTGRKTKICALVDYDLEKQAKEFCDFVILKDEFKKYENKKKDLKKLGREYDYFIAQASIMPQIATLLGRILGPLEKMPNPKAGCVVPGNIATLKPLIEKLRNTIRLRTKNELVVRALIGSEEMKDDEVAENALIVYNTLLSNLPQEKHNVKEVLVKLTMGSSIVVGKKYEKNELELLIQNKEKPSKEPSLKKKMPKEDEKNLGKENGN